MKSLITSILAVFVGVASAVAQPRAAWVSTTHDFGAFGEDMGAATTSFLLINTGDEPLAITQARANCGCTTPRYPSAPIAPGDTARIEVAYDPSGRPGRFEKHVYIDTNAEPSRTTLTIKGVVIGNTATVSRRYPHHIGPLSLQNTTAMLGRVDRGHIKNVFIDAYNTSVDTIRPVFTRVPAWLSMSVTPKAVPPGQQVSLGFFVSSDKTPYYGLVADSVALAVGDSVLNIPVFVNVVENFDKLSSARLSRAPQVKVGEERVEFGEVNANAPTEKRQFTITNTGKSPLTVHRIYTADRGFILDAPKLDTRIKPGKSLTVDVSVDPACARPDIAVTPLSARVIIITDDPHAPETPLRITAALKK